MGEKHSTHDGKENLYRASAGYLRVADKNGTVKP
jgi:hypothetical protein